MRGLPPLARGSSRPLGVDPLHTAILRSFSFFYVGSYTDGAPYTRGRAALTGVGHRYEAPCGEDFHLCGSRQEPFDPLITQVGSGTGCLGLRQLSRSMPDPYGQNRAAVSRSLVATRTSPGEKCHAPHAVSRWKFFPAMAHPCCPSAPGGIVTFVQLPLYPCLQEPPGEAPPGGAAFALQLSLGERVSGLIPPIPGISEAPLLVPHRTAQVLGHEPGGGVRGHVERLDWRLRPLRHRTWLPPLG